MTVRLPIYAAAAALLALGLGTAPALAQTGTDQQPAEQPPAAMQPPAATTAPASAPETSRRMTRLEQHIAEMHKRLHITSAEETQWNAFAQVMRDNAARMEQAFKARAAQGPDMNAVDDLRSYAAITQAHAEDMQRLVPAFEQLYTALSPAQQKDADQMFRSFERRGGHHHAG